MAVEVDIPVEINDYKEKIILGMTGRQLAGFLSSVALGFGSYFFCTKTLKLDISTAGYVVMLLTALPLAVGFLTIDGRPFESYLALIVRHYGGQHKLKLETVIPIDRSEEHVRQREKRRGYRPEAVFFTIDKKARARRRKRTAKAIAAAKKECRRAKRRYKKESKKGAII